MISKFYTSMDELRVKTEGGKTKWDEPIQDDQVIYSYMGLLITKKSISEIIDDERYIGNVIYFLDSIKFTIYWSPAILFKSSKEIINLEIHDIDTFIRFVKKSSWINRIKYFLGMDIHFNPYRHGFALKTLFNFIGYDKNANRK